MDWRDHSVTLNNVKTEEFDTELAHITVSENRVLVDFKESKHWGRITREVGEEIVLAEVTWDEVAEVELRDDHLYYPHIDIALRETGDEDVTDVAEPKRIYFLEDEADVMQACFRAITHFWNAARQRSAPPASQSVDVNGNGEAVELDQALAEQAKQQDDEEAAEDEEDAERSADAAVDTGDRSESDSDETADTDEEDAGDSSGDEERQDSSEVSDQDADELDAIVDGFLKED